jgi:hypothetical protein
MGMANRDLAPEIETMFLLTRPEMQFVSSSLVREIASHGGDFERYVTPPVAAALRERLAVDRAQGSGREAAQDLDEDSEQGSES